MLRVRSRSALGAGGVGVQLGVQRLLHPLGLHLLHACHAARCRQDWRARTAGEINALVQRMLAVERVNAPAKVGVVNAADDRQHGGNQLLFRAVDGKQRFQRA